MSTLLTYARQGLALPEVLTLLNDLPRAMETVALLYAPGWCRLATFRNGHLTGEDGALVDLADVFEARLFNEALELRWLNDPRGAGRHKAAILCESELEKAHGAAWPCQAIDVVEILPQRYLVWGEGTGRPCAPGWSELATARIGALFVPVAAVARNERVRVKSLEYLAEGEHGNVYVHDERLLKLEVAHE